MELTVNIITSNNKYGLTNDAKILVNHLSKLSQTGKNFTYRVRALNYYSVCHDMVDINFFLEIPNPLLFHHAKVNILIPNYEWFYHNWKEYLPQLDFIWCKTLQTYQIFSKYVDTEKLYYTDWTSLDRYSQAIKKDYTKILHIAGKSKYKATQQLISGWKSEWPNLTIVHDKSNTYTSDKKNIVCLTRLDEDKLVEIMNQSGIHLCPSMSEGYGHYLNEARSCKANIITIDAPPMNTFSHLLVNVAKTLPIPETLGLFSYFCPKSFNEVFSHTIGLSQNQLHQNSDQARIDYLNGQKTFLVKLGKAIKPVLHLIRDKKFQVKIPLEIQYSQTKLPKVSVVTLLYNRKRFFGLAKMNFLGVDYPSSLLEWVIVDDSDIETETITPPKDIDNLKYIRLDTKTSIGEKRNLGVKNSSGELIVMMDDDDIYPPRHIINKFSYLNHYQKKGCYSTTIGCFHIKKLVSTINIPPITSLPIDRVAEATLCFYKDFWLTRPFNDSDTHAEAHHFLKNRIDQCVEMGWKNNIISLLHQNNTSARVKTVQDTPNGCHFGISDKLFSFITSLDK